MRIDLIEGNRQEWEKRTEKVYTAEQQIIIAGNLHQMSVEKED